jgi:hypothetical protein
VDETVEHRQEPDQLIAVLRQIVERLDRIALKIELVADVVAETR